MKLSVIICSVGRPTLLCRTLESLRLQDRQADRILVSVVSPSDVTSEIEDLAEVEVLFSPRAGTSAQRNFGLDALEGSEDQVVVFLDDDVILESSYFQKVESLFVSNNHLVGLSATVLANGDVTWEEGLDILSNADLLGAEALKIRASGKHWVCHGCNMAFRLSLFERERFDEDLPLYSYAEDYDISIRAARHGTVGKVDDGLGVVHLEYKEGRVSEYRRGYSIIANNFHFLKKGVSHLPLWKAYCRFGAVIVVTETFRDFFLAAKQRFGISNDDLDYSGRFRGRIKGICDVLTGRSHPRRILEFSKS